MYKRKLKMLIIFYSLFLFFISGLNAQQQDTPRDIFTPRGTLIGDSFEFREFHFPEDRAYIDSIFARNWPNAVQLKLWGEEYSSSRRYNCHGYAWHMIGDNAINDPVWIGWHDPGQTYKYWHDGSYNIVSEQNATHVDYTADHSALTTNQAHIYISKWGPGPLMRHGKNYHPRGPEPEADYGNPVRFLYRNVHEVLVPKDYSTIHAALNAAVPGLTVVYIFPGTYTENITMKPGVSVIGSTIIGTGGGTTTINGTVTFNNTPGAGLSNVTVNNKITINHSDNVSLSNVTAGHASCWLDVSNSNMVSLNDFTSHVSRTQALYAHNNSYLTFMQSSLKNKSDGIYVAGSSADLLNTELCQNYYDIAAVFSI